MNQNMNPEIKILALGDSPTQPTGFAEVMRRVLGEFVQLGATVHIWGLGFDGSGYEKFPQFRIFPAREPWHKHLGGFLQQLNTGGYTHVFLLNDINAFEFNDFPAQLRYVCGLKRIRSLLYFPVDARLEPEWCGILKKVDVAVTYTHYAVEQVRAAGGKTPLEILPHGVDAENFRPLPERKEMVRELVMKPTPSSEHQFATEDDFLILNVNKNEWRKDPFASLRILAALKARGVPAKMILRMAPLSTMAGIALEPAGEQLGLKLDVDWTHIGAIAPEWLPKLYNAADLYLTTTLGEGWGLGITEALACGCPVALPYHSVMKEIGEELQQRGLAAARLVPLAATRPVFGPIDARLRLGVNVASAAERIQEYHDSKLWQQRPALSAAAKDWLDWPRIARAMFQLLTGKARP